MKRIVYSLLFLIFTVSSLFAQNALTYQMVVRDDNGVLVRQSPVGVKVSFLEETSNGTVVYSETHTATTNRDGLATLKVGNGTPVSGDYGDLDWSGHVYYFKTEIDPAGGTSYTQAYTELIGHAPISNYTVESTVSMTIDYNNLTNKPVLFSGYYDSLTNKPILFSGVYDSLTNKPELFDGDYYSLTNLPSILDTIYKILRDSNYLRSYTETQVLSQQDSTLTISGGNTVTLPKALFGGQYDSLINRPDLRAIMSSALADSNYLKSYTESQKLSIIGDTIYLTNSDSVVLPFHFPDLTPYLFVVDSDQVVKGTKTFTDTILVPTRIDAAWTLMGDSNQVVNYEAVTYVIDSMKRKINALKEAMYAPIVYTTSVDSTLYPMMRAYGQIFSEMKAPLTARGFCYALTPEPTLENADVVTDTLLGVGTYNYMFGPVLKDTVYYVRAYASNEYGTHYGSQLKVHSPKAPAVETSEPDVVYGNMAKLKGNVLYDGGTNVISRGFCWSTSQNPTLADTFVVAGLGNGTFSIMIKGLSQLTNYYVRAFAINAVDTAYSNEITFTTTDEVDAAPCPGSDSVVYDFDGNKYRTVKLGSQCWMAENLRSTTYNGSYINYSSSSTSSSTMYYYYPNNNYGNVQDYGYLYNWTAVTGGSSSSSTPSGIQGICPSGWHVPSSAEFDTLFNYVAANYSCTDVQTNAYYRWDIESCPTCYSYIDEDGITRYYTVDDFEWSYYDYCDYDCYPLYCGYEGCGDMGVAMNGTVENKVRALAASGVWGDSNIPYTQYLSNETVNQNNDSGFSMMPAGYKSSSSYYYGFGFQAGLWTTDVNGSSAYYRSMYNSSYTSMGKSTSSKYMGYSVRCVQD